MARSWTALALLALLCTSTFVTYGALGDEEAADVAEAEEAVDAPEPVKSFEAREGAEKFEFQAEVSRLMDIIINSLYSNKDIFLRELISNGSDALDKIRFLSLTEPDILGEDETAKLEIKISVDKEKNILTIRDRGIGMTRKQLVDNLGTIAKSGTSAFLEQMQKGGDMSLIGQFGVGFYSVYLVGDYVEVVSKNNDDKQYIWESAADGNFAVSEDTEGEPLGRGTEIRIHLKEEAQEYAELDKLKELVGKYSEFINFPIYLYESKEIEEEVEIEEEEDDDEDESEADDDEDEDEGDDEDEDEDDVDVEDEEDEPVTKKEKKTVWEWNILNDAKAIWLRSASEVEEEEYTKFYKAFSKDYQEPLTHTHFKAEGDVEFKSILFVPKQAAPDLFDNYYNRASALKLYVRRVFISDEFDELLPKYLSFVRGIVDSDTLPLSVSRETLQQHSSLKTIKKKLVRKTLDMIRKLAEDDKEDEEEKEETEEDEEKEEEPEEKENKYDAFWEQYGKAIKLGIIEDASNRMRLAKLMRFYTSTSTDKLVSLEEYVERMKDDQKAIYYLAGASLEEVKSSPFLERLIRKGYEVIYFTDPIDEYTMQSLTEFDDHKFQCASKEDLKIGDKDVEGKKAFKALKEKFKPLTSWWKELLPESDVDGVKVSARLDTTPCVVVTSKYGWSANMERIMRSQALGDAEKQSYMKGKKTLEINPRHPIIMDLLEKVEDEEQKDSVSKVAKLLYNTALLESGFTPEDSKAFASDMHALLKETLDIDPDVEVELEDETAEEEEEEEEEEPSEEDSPIEFEEVEEEEAEEEEAEAPHDEL